MIQLNLEKIAFSTTMAKELISQISLEAGLVDDDFIRDTVTLRLEAFIL